MQLTTTYSAESQDTLTLGENGDIVALSEQSVTKGIVDRVGCVEI